MSDYFNSLKDEDKERYEAKLNAIGLQLDKDPYRGEHEYEADMTSWPPVEHGHIFAYFIARPGVYTFEQLLSWKQLDGYNYFASNYVRTVMSRKIGTRGVMLKAFVNPSQKTPTKANQAWVMVKLDGTVVTAHCTCMAG